MTRSAQLKLAQKPLLEHSQTEDAKHPWQKKTLELPSDGEIQKLKEDRKAEIEREKEVAEGKIREEAKGIDAGERYEHVKGIAAKYWKYEMQAEVAFKLKTFCKEVQGGCDSEYK